MELVVTRHCETEWNAEGRLQGHTDVPLNDVGRAQARELATRLRSVGLTHVLCSDLRRASETGYTIAQDLGIPITHDARLRECAFGVLEGLTVPEIEKFYGSVALPAENFTDYSFDAWNGEHRNQVLTRQLDFLEEFATRRPDATPLLVGHGRSLGTLLAFFGHPPALVRGDIARVLFTPCA